MWICFLVVFCFLLFKCARKRAFDAGIIIYASVGWIISGPNVSHLLSYIIQVSSGLLMLQQVFLNHLSLKQHNEGQKKNASYILLLALLVALVSLSNGLGYSGVLRFVLIFIMIEYLTTVEFDSLNLAIIGVLTLQTVSCLSIFVSNQPRVPISLNLLTGDQFYPNLVGHPNYLAYVASFNCVLFLYQFKSNSFVKTFGYLLNFGAILYSQCRSAALAVVISTIFVYLADRYNGPFSSSTRRTQKNLILFVSIPLAVYFLGGTLFGRFSDLITSGGITGNNSFGWRIMQWKTVLAQVQNFFWTGVGWQNSQQFLLSGLKAHDSFLQIFLELGFFGLLIYVFLFIGILTGLASRKWGVVFIPVLLISSTVDAGILYPAIAFYLFLSANLVSRNKKRLTIENS